jgi:hypothetical protein
MEHEWSGFTSSLKSAARRLPALDGDVLAININAAGTSDSDSQRRTQRLGSPACYAMTRISTFTDWGSTEWPSAGASRGRPEL